MSLSAARSLRGLAAAFVLAALAPREASCTPNYAALYGRAYSEALARARSAYERLAAPRGLLSPATAMEATAVVFPELLRFSLLRDNLETAALEIVYVNLGRGDFSIGPFQMKPSFAERLEEWAARDPLASAELPELFIAKSEDGGRAERRERLDRLKLLAWQYRYLTAFYLVCLGSFPDIALMPPENRVAFLASAYNAGFQLPRERIEAMIAYRGYPPPRGSSAPLSYVEISRSFFSREAPGLAAAVGATGAGSR